MQELIFNITKSMKPGGSALSEISYKPEIHSQATGCFISESLFLLGLEISQNICKNA